MDIKQLIGSVIETIIKIAAVVLLVSVVYETAVKAYDYGYRVFAEEPGSVRDGRTISRSGGASDSVRDIGKNLEEKGLIRDANLFFVQELLSEYHGKIIPGIYDLNTSMTNDEMLEIMASEQKEERDTGVSTDNVPIGEVEGDTEGADGAGDAGDAENPEDAGNDNG